MAEHIGSPLSILRFAVAGRHAAWVLLLGFAIVSGGCPEPVDDDDDSIVPTSPPPSTDADEDGYVSISNGGDDCNDSNPDVNPGATEQCDGIDNNCDGMTDEGLATTYYEDGDQDTYGNPGTEIDACEYPDGYVTNGDDCDDADSSVNPAAIEVCDEIDNNCDDLVDDGLTVTLYVDADSDGYGAGDGMEGCTSQDGYVDNTGDCDDNDATTYPGAPELCDSKDNDCDGDVDEDLVAFVYRDADEDGYGDPNDAADACEAGPGYVSASGDCDDQDPAINPDAEEICDEKDNNCSGEADDGLSFTQYQDNDGDTFGDSSATADACQPLEGYVEAGEDCNDSDPASYPGADEACDGADNDCDGEIDDGLTEVRYVDQDEDGFGDPDKPAETCETDGYAATGEDCDDEDPVTHPGAGELCDQKDNDCDGEVDEDVVGEIYADTDGDGFGSSEDVLESCEAIEGYSATGGDCDDTDPLTYPGAEEVCDGKDNDCDDDVDEDPQIAWYQDEDQDGFGAGDQMFQCTQPEGYVDRDGDCNDSVASINPEAAETCNDADDNCDGITDLPDAEGNPPVDAPTWYEDADLDTFGESTASEVACEAPAGFVSDNTDCDDESSSINPDADEVCDGGPESGIDNNCDGVIDEDAVDATTWHPDEDSDKYGDINTSTTACEAPEGHIVDGTDCNDADGSIYPGAEEVADGEDNDCDGQIDDGTELFDDDSDGYTEDEGDCDDADATVYPGAEEVADGVDNDCNGQVDEGTSASDDDGDGYSEDDGDCDDGNPDVMPGQDFCPWETGGSSCSNILYAGDSEGSGFYDIDLDGSGTLHSVYCDMATDNGGWTLLGTISGVDENHWNVEEGIWSDDTEIGTPDHALDRDYKSAAWSAMNVARSDIMIRRSHKAFIRAQVVLDRACLMGKTRFKDLFAEFDTSLACTPDQMRVINDSPVGVAPDYREGENYGLGAPQTNGLCWNGEDTSDNVFKGRLVWHAEPGEGCSRTGHAGGIALFYESHEQFEADDIAETNWLDGTDTSATVISIFARALDPADEDGDGYSAEEGDSNDNDSTVGPGSYGCPFEPTGNSCSDILYSGKSLGSGIYTIQPDGGDAYQAYCDMTTDGGGWMLLGTISGSDDNRWNTSDGYWSDARSLGSLEHPFDQDYKSITWSSFDITGGEILFQRSYSGQTRGKVILETPCLGSATVFSDLFSAFDTSLACTPGDMTVLESSATGVASSSYAEGATSGIGGSGTNGLCWSGEDTHDNVFKGRLVWNEVSGANCSQSSHLGGIAVFWEDHSQYTAADITGTNWLYGTQYEKIDVSLLVRVPDRADTDGDGVNPDAGDCDDSDLTVYPGTADCPYDLGGATCAEIRDSGRSRGNGIYVLEPDDASGAYVAYCDMSTDGGGWTLLGTISGGDDNNWDTEYEYWSDENTLGDIEYPLDHDFKSPAWYTIDVTGSEVLFQRSYTDTIYGQSILQDECLDDAERFNELFALWDRTLSCTPNDIRIVESSSTGVSSATYAEGASSGIGGSGTNGWCWFGEDTESNVFKGHLFWNQYPGTHCDQGGHLGGVGVFWEDNSQYTVADITGTNWLYGTDYTATDISLFARRSPGRTNPWDWDADGFTVADGDCDDTTPLTYPASFDCPGDFGLSNCQEVLDAGYSIGDGIYLIDIDDTGPIDPFKVYCNMTTDGGGWTLLGTISGGDGNNWDEMVGYWGDENDLGSLIYPFRQDFKSPAWYLMESTGAEVLYERRYSDVLRGQAIITNPCLRNAEYFGDLFQLWDTTLACVPGAIRVVASSTSGVGSSSYAEGASSGLGGSGTNGLCWFGEDTEGNDFKGHFFWNQYPGTNCDQGGHLGGIGVFWEDDPQYTVADITGANWLYGTSYSLTDISFYIRGIEASE